MTGEERVASAAGTIAPQRVLEMLAETALALCRADAAGVSVLAQSDGESVLRWPALVGQFADALPSDTASCRIALARDEPVFVALGGTARALVVPLPLSADGEAALWVVAHGGPDRFGGEDARRLRSLIALSCGAHAAAASRAALRRSELGLRRLLDVLPVAAYACDAEGFVTHYNRRARELWGREPAPGQRFGGALRREVRDRSPVDPEAHFLTRVLEEGRPYDGEVVIERPAGDRVTVLAHASPIRDDDGALLGAVNVLVDMTERRRTLDALQESERRFARFMEHLPGLAWIKDAEGRYAFVNDAAEAAFGRPRAAIIGRTDDEIFPSEAAARFRESDRRVAESPAGLEAVESIERTDGVSHTLVRKFPIPASEDRPALVAGIAIDLTERLRAEEALRTSEQIYRAIGESIDYGVWVCDAEGRNVYASESFLRLVGLSQEEWCSNAGWGAALHPDDAERTIAAWKECVENGGQWDVEHRYRGVDGAWHPVLARGVPVRNERGETTAWAGINLDISRQKRGEDELRDAHRRKDEFLATLAHELRNPLAPIRNSLTLLRMAEVGDEPRRLLEIVARQVEQMVRLVDDLLEVSRITRNKIELRRERVTLSAVLHAAVETSRPTIEGACHRLELSLPDEELPVDGDPLRLTQVFANLLDNAARFSEPGGRIAVRAWRDGERAVVTVSDEGVGIPSTQLRQVFELFVQGDHAAGRAQGGLGIGLTLARQLAELHGGSVEANSEGPGRGSEFRVTLPLAATQPELPARTRGDAPPNAAPARARVLVVDDNHDAADSLGMLLEMLGAEARVTYDGAAALDALSSFRPQVVLLDLGMPVMDGWEVARRIREGADGAPLLVALTGWGQPDDRRRTREAGFDQHLVKPVDLSALKALFARLAPAGARDARTP
jgi:PAS domain S-box-containing protein